VTQGALFDTEEVTGLGLGRHLLGAVELADLLGRAHPPTREQVRVIEHGANGVGSCPRLAPSLVVAGAGSGKTETMAARVVWLVANRLVRPERVLGLTFTRKAAGELAERVRHRLRQLAASERRAGWDAEDDWLLGDPTISTYHAYAGRIVGEQALRVGHEPSARLLGEASTWQYAGRVVDRWDGDMSGVEWGPPAVVGAVRALASDLAEHLASPADILAVSGELERAVLACPPAPGRGGRGPGGTYAPTQEFLARLRTRGQLLPLVEAYTQRKRAAEALDYGDQVALAARIAREHSAVGEIERSRYDVVLLDEYQDTGTAQRVLLASLYGAGHPVTAVGDPCQSIYGWRGASSGNLARFPTDFPQADGSPSEVLDLTVSFRNGGRILAVANALSEDLRSSGVPVRHLRPGPKGQHSGQVVHACLRDVEEEATWIAQRVAGLLHPAEDARTDTGTSGYAPREVAVLVRTRAQLEPVERALRARGIPVEVSGLGGLLSTPEVTDVVATLRVLSDATAGAAVLRLIAGARWRLGPRDLQALARRARALARPRDPDVAAAVLEADPDPADSGSLVEALDDPGPPAAYSPEAYHRLDVLRRELRGLRDRADQPLPDLVADVARTLHLDVEVAARPGADPGSARGHLDRFLDVAAEFADAEEAPTLSAFLAYLEAAAEYERGLDAGRAGVTGDAVALLTVHGAKGLEWPVVFVPGLVRELFPGRARETNDWCRNARLLPFPLRGDAEDLPRLDLDRCADQRDVRDALDTHKAECSAREALEERRLLYVAATRAADLLVFTGYWWGRGVRIKGPSTFLREVRDACRGLGVGEDAGWEPEPEPGATNPLGDVDAHHPVWPGPVMPPERAEALARGAALVRAEALALAGGRPEEPDRAPGGDAEPGPATGPQQPEASGPTPEQRERAQAWREEVDKLLAERSLARSRGAIDVELPSHLSVSQLVALRRKPDALAGWIRRPVPLPPAPLARRGTAFHAWLEGRFQGNRLLDVDDLPGSADPDPAPDADLETLKAAFLRSEWAERRPTEVEVPFESVIDGILVRGRMDAVFAAADGVWEVVDWKTGAVPTGADAEAAAVQLAAYRLAWHRLSGEPLAHIRAAFHYVRSGATVRPVDLLEEAGLVALMRSIPHATGTPESGSTRE
jgi:DNA helicase-2/ATP-dependent DNA helicase PcrA